MKTGMMEGQLLLGSNIVVWETTTSALQITGSPLQ